MMYEKNVEELTCIAVRYVREYIIKQEFKLEYAVVVRSVCDDVMKVECVQRRDVLDTDYVITSYDFDYIIYTNTPIASLDDEEIVSNYESGIYNNVVDFVLFYKTNMTAREKRKARRAARRGEYHNVNNFIVVL